MDSDPPHRRGPPSSPGGLFEWGALLGMAAGLADGLRASLPLQASDSRVAITLLGSVVQGALLGGVSLAGLGRLLARRRAAPEGSGKPGGVPGLALLAGAVGMAAVAFLGTKGLTAWAPFLPWKAIWLLVFGGAFGLLLLTRRMRFQARGARNAILFSVLAAGSIVLGLGLSNTRVPGLERLLDHGEGSADTVGPPPGSPPNIVLVVLDTTRADRLSLYGYDKPTTPSLEALGRDSLVFDSAMSPAPWTLPAHASMFTGQPPTVHGARKERFWLASGVPTVAEILRDTGYRTVGLSCAAMVSSTFNMTQGFGTYFDVFRAVRPGFINDPVPRLVFSPLMLRLFGRNEAADKGAALTVDLLGSWLDRRQEESSDRPFFLFINLFEAHLPYDPPEPFRSRFFRSTVSRRIRSLAGEGFSHAAIYRTIGMPDRMMPEDYAALGELYDASLAYEDFQLGRILSELDRHGLLEDTAVIVAADHGENLGEHGGLLGHAFSLHQTLLHVPLLIRYPRAFEPGTRYPGVVSTESIFATILELAGARPAADWPPITPPLPHGDGPPQPGLAVSEYGFPAFELYLLVSEVPGIDISRFEVRQRAIQDGAWKLIVPSEGPPALFALSADPLENHPLPIGVDPQGAILRERLERFFAALPRHALPGPVRDPLDKATRDALRSIGYVQ